MKTVCIYHSIDLDGWMSAAIVKYWFLSQASNKFNNHFVFNLNETNNPYGKDCPSVETMDFIGYNYGQPIPDLSEYDKVIMCDISFPKEEMLKITNRLGVNFMWIDHHQPKIEEISKYLCGNYAPTIDGLTTIEGRPKFAACELTWKYFFPNEPMPEIVRLLGRYDCFGHKGTDEEQKVLEFQYGARQCISNYEEAYNYLISKEYHHNNGGVEDIVDFIWKKGVVIYQYLCTEAKQVYSTKSSMIFYNESLTKLDFYTYIEDDGDVFSIRIHDEDKKFSGDLYLYKDSQNSAYIANIDVREDLRRQGLGTNLIKNIEDYAVKRNITDISLRVEPNTFIHHWYLKLGYSYCKHDINTNLIWMKKDLPIVRFVAINRERFNPINFGIDYHKDGYDGVVSFHYDGSAKLWRYSLYNDNGKVDCSAIAKQFGGGGHFSASGFICDNNTFLQIIGDILFITIMVK